MAKKQKNVQAVKVERPKRITLTEEETLKRMDHSTNERSDSSPLYERARVEVHSRSTRSCL